MPKRWLYGRKSKKGEALESPRDQDAFTRQASFSGAEILAHALEHALRFSDEEQEKPLELQRRISNVAEQEAETVRADLDLKPDEMGAVGTPEDGGDPISWSTFLLPSSLQALGVFPIATEIEKSRDLYDPSTSRSIFGWVPPSLPIEGTSEWKMRMSCLMRALRTDGDGNCLLHACGLAMWGVHDRKTGGPLGPLRDQVASILAAESFVKLLLARLAAEDEREDAAIRAIMPEAARTEARSEGELRRDIGEAAATAAKPHAFMGKLHIYALAHALRRPLVVYAATGDELALDSIDGVYLPDLWAETPSGESGGPIKCEKKPIALAYTGGGSSGHFTACVTFDGYPHALPLTDHVGGKRLPLRFAPDYTQPGVWDAIVGAHTDLGFWEHGGARYPLAWVSREPCKKEELMLPSVLAMRERFVTLAAAAAAEAAAAALAPLPPLPPPPEGWHEVECTLTRVANLGFGLDVADDGEIGGIAPGSSAHGVLQPGDRIAALNGRELKGSLIEAIMAGPDGPEHKIVAHRRSAVKPDTKVAVAPPKGMPPALPAAAAPGAAPEAAAPEVAPDAPPADTPPAEAAPRAAPRSAEADVDSLAREEAEALMAQPSASAPPAAAAARRVVPAGVDEFECSLSRGREGLGLAVDDQNIIGQVDAHCSAADFLRVGDRIVALNGTWLQGPIVTALDPARTVHVFTVHRRGVIEKPPTTRVPSGLPPGT